MRRDKQTVTIENIRATRRVRAHEIRKRLAEFRAVWEAGSDERLWEELVYCIFTAGASARMGLRSVEAVRHLLLTGDQSLPCGATGLHRRDAHVSARRLRDAITRAA